MVKIDIDTQQEKYSFEDLLRIMQILRSPGGCPWDIEQTHKSIRNDTLEEAYEVCDAIDLDNPAMICEELGDMLLQVVFHSNIAAGYGTFDISDVITGISKKLILRHPHVFGTVKADTPEQVLDNWDKIKMQEKSQETFTDTLSSVPMAFPALLRAQKVQKRAAKAGYDFKDVSDAVLKLREETDEVVQALKSADAQNIEDEIGDLLFSAVNVARKSSVNSEHALTGAVNKFIKRFSLAEQMANENGVSLSNLSEAELDELWQKAKQF